MECRPESLITVSNFTTAYQEQNGVNSGSVVPVIVFIMNKLNLRDSSSARFMQKKSMLSALYLFVLEHQRIHLVLDGQLLFLQRAFFQLLFLARI